MPWLFSVTPRGFWLSRDNRVRYINWLLIRVGVANVNELKNRHFVQNAGGGLISLFGNSPNEVLKSIAETSEEVNEHVLTRLKPRHYWVLNSFLNLPFTHSEVVFNAKPQNVLG